MHRACRPLLRATAAAAAEASLSTRSLGGGGGGGGAGAARDGDKAKQAAEPSAPYLTVFTFARKPMTKMIKAAYKAHREQRMLHGAERDRELALQVDEILHVGTSNPIPMMIDRIEAMRGYQ